MDYVDRETKAWHEALKKARALNPWVSTGKEFKPSIDQDYGDLMRAQNGGKVFAALRDRTPRLPGAKTNSSTTFEINNQFKTSVSLPPNMMQYLHMKKQSKV